MLKIQSGRIIIDGHEPTKEQCETMTLLANALEKSRDFKTVEYRDGYAEFEKVGKAEELKFPSVYSISYYTYDGSELIGSSEANMSSGDLYVKSDGIYGSATVQILLIPNLIGLATEPNGEIVYNVGDIIPYATTGNLYAKQSSGTTKVSVDLTTLPGWSALAAKTYNITIVAKADGYRDSAPSAAVSVTKGPQEYTDCITFTGESSDFTLAIGNGGYKEWDGTVEYSTDHNTWKPWYGATISSVDKKLYLRGSGNTKFCTRDGARLSLSARAACSGNLNTLLEYSNPPTIIPASSCYASIFYGCTNLTTAPELPATTLADECYASIFYGCTNLTTAPELPATTLANGCYVNMFNRCSSLVQAPELPATTLANYCYSGMFYNCTNLTTAPTLPATTLTASCYQHMFCGCTNLTQAPELPATTLADYCYAGMFDGCTSLTTAPELPATTLADYCYASMFYGCTGLTQAPALPATTLADYCYESMFFGCTNLTQAPELPATTLANSCYASMFYNCTSLTTAPTLPATTLTASCYENMFNGCTNLTQAPALPATTLVSYCYHGMFYGCTSLTTAPELPATTLADYCYAGMFDGCTAFKVSSTKTGTYQYAWRIPTSGTISSEPSRWNTKMLAGTGGTFTSNPAINTTYYIENAPV